MDRGLAADNPHPAKVRQAASRYRKIIYWSDEDKCFIGLCPGLFYGGCHGPDDVKVYQQLCSIAEEVVEIHFEDKSKLPPVDAGILYELVKEHIEPGKLLREEFMKPLGITAEQISASIPLRIHPKGPVFSREFWTHQIKVLIGEEIDELARFHGPDDHLFLALDRFFGLPVGFFLQVWADYQADWKARDVKAWLSRVKTCRRPVHKEAAGIGTKRVLTKQVRRAR